MKMSPHKILLPGQAPQWAPTWYGTEYEPVNSTSISGMLTPTHFLVQKVTPRWLPIQGNFVRQFQSSSRSCTSVPVLYTTLIFSFCLVRLRKHSQPWKKCTDELLLDQFYIFECLKGFIIAVWPKNCPKFSKGGKLTVKKGRARSFLNYFFRDIFIRFVVSLVIYFRENM